MENGPGNGVPSNGAFFSLALNHLTAKKNIRWIHRPWFTPQSLPFLDALTPEEAKALLDALLVVPKIQFQVERILCQVARKHLALVWKFFGQRLKSRSADKGKHHFEAFPYQFHGLEKELSKDVPLAVSTVRQWYAEDPTLFRFLGGRLLSNTFPTFGPEISHALGELVTNGTSADADFVLAVMENYRGEHMTHEVLKRVVAKYPDDQNKLTGVIISFDNTGVVSGEFGFVDATRRKKAAMEPWLADQRREVRTFAATYMRQADLRIADEQQRAETSKALRELEYDEGDKDGA
jgi:hypothetical protein